MTKAELKKEIKHILRHTFTYSDDINGVTNAIADDVRNFLGEREPSMRGIEDAIQVVLYNRVVNR